MCIIEAGKQEEARVESFCGSVKSFNTRRGFGFLSCKETAQRFGRDVYLSKEEATLMLGGEPAIAFTSGDSATDKEKTKGPPPVLEGDILLFQVKLSMEGFPQAVQAQKIRRLRGVVRQAPVATAEGIITVTGDGSDGAEVDAQLFGAEVRLRQAECGQLLLQPNDEVAFCCVNMTDGQSMEAQLIDLLQTPRTDGSVLGCFSLALPQLGSIEDGAPNMHLHGYALTDRIVLSDIPSDLAMPDLMRLFGKLGGEDGTVTGNGTASIMFNGPESVAKFLTQATHTMSENGITQLAHVSSCSYRKHGGDCCNCAPNNWSRSVETTPVAQSASQSICTPCVNVSVETRSLDSYLATSAPILSTPPMSPQVQNSFNFGSFPAQSVEMPMMTRTSTSSAWRCMHNSIVVPSAAPEMFATGDICCGVCMQWPTVIHASSYVVEFVDQTSMVAQRFTHISPEGMLPTLMTMHLDGLQHSSYAACVRCVAPCGCESTASPWSFVSGAIPLAPPVHMLAPNVAQLLQPNAPTAAPHHSCPPPPMAPPTFPSTASLSPMPMPLPPILEEGAMSVIDNCPEDILTLD